MIWRGDFEKLVIWMNYVWVIASELYLDVLDDLDVLGDLEDL